ncbi:hypothetical protein CC117_12365 [Parafrankia colletiae]|uniref:Uncharacterized protein n=1 Tax=Parafrankia colletiae TaxID=573497 RepID=A0A1S1R843_9ACTN|nr:hypothetical protein [Parafrankia colletiae]MCK9900104.1 hypothetical protein [Frankia sp. Cpl3]OHV42350.1 hypothetical protein CC117_12365 [Parafrankia colletiae]
MAVLPAQFADLEPFADWAIQGERARYDKRFTSSMDELQAFYDAAFARIDDARAYLEQVPYDAEMKAEDQRLTWLYSALCTVSFPVEVWRQARVPDSGPSAVDAVLEPAI